MNTEDFIQRDGRGASAIIVEVTCSSRRKEALTLPGEKTGRKTETVCVPLNWRADHFPCIRMLRLSVSLPELRPEIVLKRMQPRITRDDSTTERPFAGVFHESVPHRVFQNVLADTGESTPTAFFVLEHVIVRLVLELLGRKPGFELRPQDNPAVELVGIPTQSHPD